MHVIDAEYQFDRHKLTFFFEAEGRIDFRELVRDLFSIYKTRIWMQQLDKTDLGSKQQPPPDFELPPMSGFEQLPAMPDLELPPQPAFELSSQPDLELGEIVFDDEPVGV
jgi:hypothetical protein